MAGKLTLYVDDDLVPKAKLYAKKRGSSVSQLVNNFLRSLQETPELKEPEAPVTASLKGVAKGATLDEADYKNYLEKKYL